MLHGEKTVLLALCPGKYGLTPIMCTCPRGSQHAYVTIHIMANPEGDLQLPWHMQAVQTAILKELDGVGNQSHCHSS